MAAVRRQVRRWVAASIERGYDAVVRAAAIGPDTAHGERFAEFGTGSIIRFPQVALLNEGHIAIGRDTMIGQHITLSAGMFGTSGMSAGLVDDVIVRIGDRCLIGQGSGIVGHLSITIGDDVMTGHHVYITDQNHGFDDITVPIRAQWGRNKAVRIGDGSWIGYGSVILPGADIGRNVVIGANSVVTGVIPDFTVAAGVPARVVRHLAETER